METEPVNSPLRRVAIIQARMSSTRLPGKVLIDLAGLPLIVFMAKRVQQARCVDSLIVATSVDASDDPLAAALDAHGITCFRGNLNDVLDRFYQAATEEHADHVVRLTGDCPLMDADLVDRALNLLAESGADYVSNCVPPTFPDGLDVEAFTMSALKTAWANAQMASEREHVTPYLREPSHGMKLGNWQGLADLSYLRWTVDHPDDLDHVRALVSAAGRSAPESFDRFDLYRIIEQQPHQLTASPQHVRNEGYLKSIANDHAVR